MQNTTVGRATALGRGRARRLSGLAAAALAVLLGLALPVPAVAAPGGHAVTQAAGSTAGATTTAGPVVAGGQKALARRSKSAFGVPDLRLTRTAATTRPTTAQDAVAHYRFDNGTQGWKGENVALGHDRITKAEGTGSLRLSGSVSSSWTAPRDDHAHR